MMVLVGSRGAGRASRRRGSMLAEAAMSGVILAIAMALTVKVLGWVALERRAVERRQWAAQEVCNVMERITARPYDAVTPGAAGAIALSEHARRMLPGAELEVEVAEDDPAGGKGSKKVSVRLRWKDRSGGWDAPARLVSWLHRGRAGS
jgi:hypothetical protein